MQWTPLDSLNVFLVLFLYFFHSCLSWCNFKINFKRILYIYIIRFNNVILFFKQNDESISCNEQCSEYNKVGDPKDNIRRDVRSIMQLLCTLYSNAKVFNYIVEGLKSKNAKQRTGQCHRECRCMYVCNSSFLPRLQFAETYFHQIGHFEYRQLLKIYRSFCWRFFV